MAEIEQFTARAPRRGNIDVPTDTGMSAALANVAQASAQITSRLGQAADRAIKREALEDAAAHTTTVDMPGVEYAFDGSSQATSAAKPFKTSDPVATDLPAHARAFLNAVAGGESGGSYNVRYTPGGPAHFADMSKHPEIFVPGPHGRTSAAGRYQFTASTWNGIGGGDFSPANQDRQAWKLAQRDYKARTGRSLDGDLRQNGLSTGMLSALSGTWAAFNANQGRHVATYNDSLSRYAAAPSAPDPMVTGSTGATASAPASPQATGGVKITLTGSAGQVPQVQAGTLYGDTYNAAALDIHLNRLDTAMRSQMEAVALQHEGDPASLAGSLDALREGYVRDLPPQAAALIDQSFARQKFGLQRQAVQQFNQNLESANIAAFEQNISARTDQAFRLAAKAGLDAAADAAIAGELGALTAQIDASPLTPLQKSRFKADAQSGVLTARILGGFEAQKDPVARAAYVKKFQDDWKADTGLSAEVDAGTYQKINGELIRQVQADAVAADKRATALEKSIGTQISVMKKGWPVDEAQRSFVRNEVAKTGNAELVGNLKFLDGLADWQKAHVAARPEVVDAQISALKAKIQSEGATEAALTTLDVMEGLRDQMTKGLSTDPLTWANRAGVAKVEPLNFADSTSLSASLAERVADASAIGKHYGVEPKFFTEAEADGLKKMLRQTPLALPSIVSSLSAGLGEATPRALGEISKEAPLLAHVGGLMHMTGSQGAAVEIAEALERRNQPGYKSALPTAAKLQSAAAEALGSSLLVLPGTQAGAMEAAAALFEARALSRGIDMDRFDEAGDPARQLYMDALDEVLGATRRDGVKFGGVTEVNGLATIAPPDIEADALADMVANISADDLIFQQAISSANGVPIRPEALRAGQLVMASQGRYRVALGDIAGGNPLYVPGVNGGFFELDIGMLKRTQQGRDYLDTPGNTRRRTILDWSNRTR